MSAHVQFVVELEVTPGKTGAFHALITERVSASEPEPHPLASPWSFSAVILPGLVAMLR